MLKNFCRPKQILITSLNLSFGFCNLKDIELTPGILTVITADTHLYLNHLEQVNINLERRPKPFPKLIIKEKR